MSISNELITMPCWLEFGCFLQGSSKKIDHPIHPVNYSPSDYEDLTPSEKSPGFQTLSVLSTFFLIVNIYSVIFFELLHLLVL